VFEPAEISRGRWLWECASGLLHLRAVKALARLITIGVPLAIASLTVPGQALSEPESVAAAPESPEPAAADASSADPAKLAPELSEPTHFYSRTASKQWVDRLTKARRRVLSAHHAVDAANAAYARALYEKMPEGAGLQTLTERRKSANDELASALNAIPGLVDKAREDGVSPEILTLYEDAMMR